MFEQSNGLDAGSNAGMMGSNAPASSSIQPQEQGQFYTQAQLNQIMANVKKSEQEKLMRLQQDQPQYYEQKYRNPETQRRDYEDQLSEMRHDIHKQVKEELAREQQQQQYQFYQQQSKQHVDKTLQTWEQKKQLGSQKYKDFGNVVNENDWALFTNTFDSIVNNIDNAEDVIYELSKNPKELMLLESQRKNELEAAQKGVQSDFSLRTIKQLSKELKDKMAKNNNSSQQNSSDANQNNGVNFGMPSANSNNHLDGDYLRRETDSYLNSLSSSAVLSVDRTGPQAVADYDKMYRGQF